ncbi:MAG: hypothetical protein PHE25_02585 [Candidatus Gracilibacteria bacterium]|nr:hypothetical protein [Candidatus Gracilibacteria bacterium]
MKKEYLFLIFIVIILYLLYLILDYKYKEYKINNHIELIEQNNEKMRIEIQNNKETLEYINTKAYKNKVLKEEQSMKNKGEVVIFITNEDDYNKFSKNQVNETQVEPEIKQIQDSMDIYQKWMYFLFKKDVR